MGARKQRLTCARRVVVAERVVAAAAAGGIGLVLPLLAGRQLGLRCRHLLLLRLSPLGH